MAQQLLLLYLFLGSLLVSLLLFAPIRGLLARAGRYEENYRGQPSLLGIGILYLVIFILFEAVVHLFFRGRFLDAKTLSTLNTNLMILVLGIGLLGLIDDAFGKTGHGGFRGHIGALLRGHLTTGAVKAFGVGLLSLVVAARLPVPFSWDVLIVNALLIALCANTFNLFDLRPGRALKVFFLVYLVIFAFTVDQPFWQLAIIFIGPALIIFPSDVSGQVMLGDVGSNVMGAVVGLALVTMLGFSAKLFIAFVLVALHLVTEAASISDFIERVPILRWLDELGRR